jgi:folylpolyglutamate synthase/dihydropteroate synthase
MTYSEAEQYILSFSNLPRTEYMQNPKDCVQYLKRVQFFLDRIKNPERKIPHFIHVTGTSGKGSVCAFLQSILVTHHKKNRTFCISSSNGSL